MVFEGKNDPSFHSIIGQSYWNSPLYTGDKGNSFWSGNDDRNQPEQKDLRGKDLAGTYLTGADLRGADLGNANLTGALLRGANLTGAYLKGANLTEADLRNANLTFCDLGGTLLDRANLSESCFMTGTNLSGASLKDTNLKNAKMWLVDLQSTDMSSTDLSGALIVGVNFDRALMQGARVPNIPGIYSKSNSFQGTYPYHADLRDLKLKHKSVHKAWLAQNESQGLNLKQHPGDDADSMMARYSALANSHPDHQRSQGDEAYYAPGVTLTVIRQAMHGDGFELYHYTMTTKRHTA